MSSNVIKARALQSSGRPAVIKRDVQIALRNASEIVARANGEAQTIVSGAQAKAQIIFDSARESGYESGAAQWYSALAEAWKSRDEYLAANENTLLTLAVRIAEKLINEELRTAPDTVASIVKEALRSTRRARKIAVQVHPDDADIVQKHLAALRAPAAAGREIEIVPNDSLSRGDCMVETDIGIIDARLETQLKNMERALNIKT